ncbi:hypothetical protein [Aquimarina sp. AU119]|uniref:hypothetical protein n=1 Tax=Aquimarina sp. AU119 TaxID=2108528 RepID=UPI000D6983A5|nr:hypothetical protein [Aquimarina sp. AU119]
MTSKLSRTLFLGISLILAILVPITAPQWYNSLSAHADSTNEIIYNGMHLFSIFFFFLNAPQQKRNFDYIIGLGMGSILLTNMNDFPIAHNICTALTLATAIYSMLYYCSKKNRVINIYLASSIVIVFVLGYLSKDIYFAMAEIIAMWIVGIHMARRIWIGARQ